ncbi:hypothetical protein Lal_00023682 [Lupinus albus]|uniref:Putative fruit bromelain n=1 Tax=Lupinus albus TaxID=3870 RepID=A0A6A5PMX2_LUPAL|nr:putative fruit bromelain [Lupinus albus]KAF1898673.1 hypothetical protein Lal_00023682 [Lupinus albus]
MISYTPKLFLIFFIITTFITLFMLYYPNSSQKVHIKHLDKHLSEDEVIQLFKDWKKEYGRVYKDNEEMAKKFVIFTSNLNYIIESNARRNSPSSHILGLNKFSDWSQEEFKETYLNQKEMAIDSDIPTDNGIELKEIAYSEPPSSLDWRKKGAVSAVKHQGTCGCCWAFSAVGGIEGINAIATKKLITLSTQELVDCDTASCGCKNGRETNGWNWVIKNGGIASDAAYPYKAEKGTCQASKIANSATISSFAKVAISEDALWRATAIQPISVNVDSRDFQYYTKHTGILDGRNCKNTTDTNHAVLIVGYDRSKAGVDYWIVKNSWGQDWGKKGYIWIQRNTGLPYGVCAINAWAYYPIKK